MFDITAQLNIDSIGRVYHDADKRGVSLSLSQWLLSDCPLRGSNNTLRVEETGKDLGENFIVFINSFDSD